MQTVAPDTSSPRGNAWSSARFSLVAWVLPVATMVMTAFAATAAFQRFVGPDVAMPQQTWTVAKVGCYATIAAIGFARSARGLTIERMRYRSAPMSLAELELAHLLGTWELANWILKSQG